MTKRHLLHSAYWLAATLAATAPARAGSVVQTNLVSDGSVPAAVTDPNLVNPWGISFAPTGAFWVSDNNTGLTTLYDGTGAIQSLVVTIPPPAGATGHSAPTGQVYNGSTDFPVTENGVTGASSFIFDTEDGTISGWSPAVDFANAVTVIDNSATGAVYKGLALYSNAKGNFLLATNFRSGFVEVYDGQFKLRGQFRDQGNAIAAPIPTSYAPFNVAVLNGHIYVSYAHVDAARHDDLPGIGFGYVDEVALDGRLLRRIVSHGPLNAPWGLAIAPPSFGRLAGTLLVGNFGDGHVSAFSLANDSFAGQLKIAGGAALAIDGLWALTPGNGTLAGSTNTIYFSAGPQHETHGLFGSLDYTP